MNCIIIEDQPPAQRILKKYIADYGSFECVGVFGDAIKGLEYLKNNEVDLIFLDIHLPKLSGMDFLRSLQNPPAVILTTAFSEFALESYELNVVDYLLKPFSFTRFIQVVGKAMSKIQVEGKSEQVEEFIFIKSGYEFVKIKIAEILFIKADSDYTEIVTRQGKQLSSESLKHWLAYFGDQQMIRVHKSYIVNKLQILKVNSHAIALGGQYEVPIGRAYKDDVAKLIEGMV